jgi:hypothetical protein
MVVIEVQEIVAVVVEATGMEEEGIVLRRGPLVLCPSEEKITVVFVPPSVPIYTNRSFIRNESDWVGLYETWVPLCPHQPGSQPSLTSRSGLPDVKPCVFRLVLMR